MPKPKPPPHRLIVTIDEELRAELDAAHEATGRPRAWIIRRSLRRQLIELRTGRKPAED